MSMFLGVASVPRYGSISKERFPIAVGVAYLDTRAFQTILIKPPESWGLINLETEHEREGREKKKKRRRVQILAHITDEELLKKGTSPEDAADIILSLVNSQAVYSLDRKHDLEMLNVLSLKVVGKISLLSTMALSNEYTSPDRAMNLQLHCKLRMGLYPRNKADVRWIVPWIDQCRNKGSVL